MPGNLGIAPVLLEEHGDPAGGNAIAQGFRQGAVGRHAARRNLGQQRPQFSRQVWDLKVQPGLLARG